MYRVGCLIPSSTYHAYANRLAYERAFSDKLHALRVLLYKIYSYSDSRKFKKRTLFIIFFLLQFKRPTTKLALILSRKLFIMEFIVLCVGKSKAPPVLYPSCIQHGLHGGARNRARHVITVIVLAFLILHTRNKAGKMQSTLKHGKGPHPSYHYCARTALPSVLS